MATSMRSIAILFCILTVSLSLVDAQTAEQAQCIKEMLPCREYLHSDKPPSTCCFAMKGVLAAHVDCMCAVVNNAALLATYHMTRDQALKFPSKCNITIDPNVCGAPPPGSEPPPSPSHGSTPPPKSSASRISQGSAGTMAIVATVVIAVFSSIISSSM